MTILLEVKGLAKSFGGVQAVKGIDFAVMEGRCTALLGPNGAGKTTTIRMLTGLLKASAGTVAVGGAGAAGTGSEIGDRRAMLGYLPQAPSFYNWMSGLEYAAYAGKLCGLAPKQAKERAKELLAAVGLEQAGNRRIGGYSGGMKQRLGLAQALVHRPRLLVMDEPVSALDPIGRREVLTLLQGLKSETTILFSTHLLHDAEELCDDIVIMASGEVALQGSLQGIRSENRQPLIELDLEEGAESKKWLQAFVEKRNAGVYNAVPDSNLKRTNGTVVDNVFNPGEDSASELRGMVKEAELRGYALKLSVDDLAGARQLLLQELAEKRLNVRRLELGYSSLEDLFMKAVGV